MLNANNSYQPALQLDTQNLGWSGKLQRSWPLLTFAIMSMMVQISMGQEDTIDNKSLTYLLLIGPALLLPFFNLRQILTVLFTHKGILLLAFGILAVVWHMLRGDTHAVLQLILLVWVIAWVAGSRTPFLIKDLIRLYVFLLIIGIFIVYLTDMNVWGVIPGSTREDYGIWRVSFFPNIANTGILSLFMFFILTRDKETILRHPIALAVCLYFLIFSFVRTAQIAAFLYLFMRLWFHFGFVKRFNQKNILFWSAISATLLVHLFIVAAPFVLEYLQSLPIVSRLFLRGAEGLSTQEIFQQAYRPWLWLQHIYLFTTSSGLMGLGVFEFDNVIEHGLLSEHVNTGSESFPTRLLASFGLPFLLFLGLILTSLKKRAEAADQWACACFPAIFLLMMNWGSVFHPTNAFFIFFFFILFHGSSGFLGKYSLPR